VHRVSDGTGAATGKAREENTVWRVVDVAVRLKLNVDSLSVGNRRGCYC